MKIYHAGIFLIALLVSGSGAAQQADTKSATLRVKVTAANGPAIGALVSLSGKEGNSTITEQGYTNEAGEKEFTGLPGGAYSLSITKPAFFLAAEFANQLDKIYLDYGQSKTLNINLTKGGTITGRLLDREGDAIPGIPVSALKIDAAKKNYSLPPKSESNAVSLSDDKGAFSIYGLRPGNYLIAVNAQRNNSPQKTISPIYYPNQSKPESALPVIVGLSQEIVLPDMQMAMDERESYSLAGAVRGANQTGVAEALVSLTKLGGEAISDSALTDSNGQFRFEGLAPGKYKFTVNAKGQPYFNAEKEITLTNSSLNNLVIELPPYPLLEGRVYFSQDPKDQKANPFPGLDIRLVPLEGGDNLSFSSGANGKFSLKSNRDGQFYWDFPTLAQEYYVERITAAGKDNYTLQLNKKTGVRNIALYIQTGAAQIDGQLEASAVGGCRKFAVYALALNNAAPTDITTLKRANSCAGNSFSIYSLAPGSYYLVALPLSAQQQDVEAIVSASPPESLHLQALKTLVKKSAFGAHTPVTVTRKQKYSGPTPVIIPPL